MDSDRRWRISDFKAVANGILGRGGLPDALIIGAQKAGTSSLFHMLSQHPNVGRAPTKEVHFFDTHFARGSNWYKGQFRPRAETLLVDATPYYLFHPPTPARAAALLPGAKLIVLLREPVARAFSHYQHERARGREELGFEQAIAAEAERLGDSEQALADGRIANSPAHRHCSYVRRGFYVAQIERWRRHYPLDRFLFLKAEDLFAAPRQAFDRTCAFLGLPPFALPDTRPCNQRSYDAMSPEIRVRLAKLYEEPNARLAELSGIAWPEQR